MASHAHIFFNIDAALFEICFTQACNGGEFLPHLTLVRAELEPDSASSRRAFQHHGKPNPVGLGKSLTGIPHKAASRKHGNTGAPSKISGDVFQAKVRKVFRTGPHKQDS